MRRAQLMLAAYVVMVFFVLLGAVAFSHATPVITSLSPTAAPIGGDLYIEGSGFGTTLGTVTINSQTVQVSSWADTFIHLVIPSYATTGSVVVIAGGVSSRPKTLTIDPAPKITKVVPTSGPVGTSLTITGTHLFYPNSLDTTVVDFYPAGSAPEGFCGPSLAEPATATTVTVPVPPGAVTGKIAVNSDGVETTPVNFTVTGTLATVADAGSDQAVPMESTVTLNGAASYDLSGLPLTYLWSLVSVPTGSGAILSNPTSPVPTFVPDLAGPYELQLTVNNGSFSSAPAFVTLWATPYGFVDVVPSAGPDQTVGVGSTVQLDASGTAQLAGTPIAYQWYLWYLANNTSQWVYQGTSPFSNSNSVNPTFVANAAGTYFAELSEFAYGSFVSPDYLTPWWSQVKISTVNSAPVASAGPGQNIQGPQTVQLDGTGSTDVDGNALTYSWAILSKPAGSAATLSSSTFPRPTFYADVVGPYVIQLIVNDGTVNNLPNCSWTTASRTATVTITNSEIRPLANPGPAQTVPVGNTVTLSGEDSTDFEGHALSYSWSLLSTPGGSTASLSLSTSPNPYFTADKAGKYVVQLVVNDGITNSSPQTVLISTDSSRPVADPGPNQTVGVGSTVQLSGAGSTDADGDALTYNWSILYKPSGASAVLSSATTVDPTFVANVAGLYVAQLIVSNGQLNSNPVTTWINAAVDQPPVVSAGPNQIITLPINRVTLYGSATSYGLPNHPLTVSWTQVSGPAGVTFSSPDTAVTDALFSAAGTYVLQISANDSQLNSSATATVTVNSGLITLTLTSTQSQVLIVPGTAGPWTVSGNLNAAYPYGNSGATAPTTFPVTAGEQVTVQYLSGLVQIGVNYFAYDGFGSPRDDPNGGTGNSSPEPLQYSSISANGGCLAGAWADATGQIVAAPFPVNDGGTFTAPVGAVQLQLGVNDILYSDNTGSWSVKILAGAQGITLSAGPDATGTSQTVRASVTQAGAVVTGVSVQFTVTGANATTGGATTDSAGFASFTYTGTKIGNDSVQATYGGSASNAMSVVWITPVQQVSTGTSFAKFFLTNGSCTFNTPSNAVPVFTQEFPTIDFNPPTGTVQGNNSGIGVNTRPFTDVTTNVNGTFSGTVVAQGNSYQVGVGAMSSFQAEYVGSLTVASAGNETLDLYDDGGFILGIGGGAARVSGPLTGAPATGVTPFAALPVVGAYNQEPAGGPTGNVVVVNFPAAGTYAYELDYTACSTSELSMTMAVGASNSSGVPPTGTLVITPTNPAPIHVGNGNVETLTVQATDGSGAAVPNLNLAFNIYGTNEQFLSGTTNTSGQATIQYSGTFAGVDSIQAIGSISGMATVSNAVQVTWLLPNGGGGNTFVQQGWIGAPLIGTVVQGQVPITVASGTTLTSGVLEYWPTSNPSAVTILNSNTTGSGTIGTFDGTLVPSGGYTIQLNATSSTGATQISVTAVTVTGEYKPGRERVTVTDFKVPLAGIPISISRTYDSLARATVGDFGNGWSLAVGVNLTVDAFNNVTFNFNNQAVTFNFVPQAQNGLFPWLLVPVYTPAPGYHGTLTSDGCSALVQVQASVACFPGGSVYQAATYFYTDPSGRMYTIAATGQIELIKDLNNNTLTFAPTGITSSVGGVVVPFVRDGQGRITQITDLNQNNYVYTYDTCGSGDLCSVTFPGISTPAKYTYANDHSLLTKTDPNNDTWTYTYYTDAADNGRLMSATSPFVNAVSGGLTQYVTQYSYNVATNTTATTNPDTGIVTVTVDNFGNPLTIVDALNNTKTFTYYPNETVKTYVDPLHNPATSYTYDANGFLTSLTDPRGTGYTTTWINNQYGGVTSTTDAAKQDTTITGYDTFFNPSTSSDSFGPLYTRTFDSMGDVLTQTDANGNTTQFTYDSRGNLLKVVDALNEVTSNTYDAMDRVLSRTDPRQNQTFYTYDALGNLTARTDAAGRVWSSTYDLNGNRTSDVDPLGQTTSYTYDALNRLITTTYPDKTTETINSYDFRNNKLLETDRSGRVRQYQYDLDGQLRYVTYALGTPDAGTVQHTYDQDGDTKTVTDEDGNPTTYNYDAANNLMTVQDALGHVTQYFSDADNRRYKMIDANNNPATTYGYDARSRLNLVTHPDTTTDKYVWDGVGNQTSATDQAQQTTLRYYDAANRLSSVKDANGYVTKYGYDPAGNLLSITDANNHVTSFQYDSLNHKVVRTLPIGMVETYAYNEVGNITAKTDFNGKTTIYGYDPLNRLLQKTPDPTLSEPNIVFTYYPTGTRQTMTDSSGQTTYTYDNRDRLKTKTTPEGTLSYTYDKHSNVLTILSSNTNGASVTYTPDQLNRLSTVLDDRLVAQGVSSATTTYTYYPMSTVQNYTYSTNTVQTAYTYDTLNRLKSVGSAKGSSNLSSFTYSPFPALTQTVSELSGRGVSYGYDNDYHLQSETVTADPAGNNGTESYTYDFVGNRKMLTSNIPSLRGSVSYTYDINDRLNTDSYDNDGNTTVSLGVTNTYDFENRMLTHGTVSMVYDGDGIRVSETAGGVTTTYLVDTLNPTGYSQVFDELVSDAVTKTYTYGLQRISENQLSGSTWTPTFYGYDGHGNVRFLTSSTGTVGNTYQFDAFGMPIASTGTTASTYLYSGERFDSNLGLYHLGARYYNQATGRFETMDPGRSQSCCALQASQWDNIFYPGTLHKYVYTQDNPANRIDPTGQADAEEEGALDANFLRYVRNFKKFMDPAARSRICAAAALIRAAAEGLDPDATWAAYIACILKNSAGFN